jgi:hypothetical protein
MFSSQAPRGLPLASSTEANVGGIALLSFGFANPLFW